METKMANCENKWKFSSSRLSFARCCCDDGKFIVINAISCGVGAGSIVKQFYSLWASARNGRRPFLLSDHVAHITALKKAQNSASERFFLKPYQVYPHVTESGASRSMIPTQFLSFVGHEHVPKKTNKKRENLRKLFFHWICLKGP